jgi:hypothetical protein
VSSLVEQDHRGDPGREKGLRQKLIRSQVDTDDQSRSQFGVGAQETTTRLQVAPLPAGDAPHRLVFVPHETPTVAPEGG